MKLKLLLGLALVLAAIGCNSNASRRAAIASDVLHPPPSLEQASRSLYVGMSSEELDRLAATNKIITVPLQKIAGAAAPRP